MNENEPAKENVDDVAAHNCPDCNKSFKKVYNLARHIRREHIKPTCTICGDCFLRMKILKEHALASHEVKLNKLCSLCKKAYSSRRDLENHLQGDHEQEKPLICSKCSRMFTTEERLKSHVLNHSRSKSFRCSVCSKTFYSSSKLTMHKREDHHVERKFLECPECGGNFQANDDLCKRICELHMEVQPTKVQETTNVDDTTYVDETTNVDETAFACKYCEEVFEERRMVSFHVRKEHVDKCTFNCDKCHFIFDSEKGVKRHMMIRHIPRRFKCGFCHRSFWRKYMLQKHESLFHGGTTNEDVHPDQNELGEVTETVDK